MDPQRGGFLQRGSEYKKLENLYEQENAGNWVKFMLNQIAEKALVQVGAKDKYPISQL